MEDLPTYYRPNAHLEVQLSKSTVSRKLTVVRPITPFTVASVLVVREITASEDSEELILKAYDPRFINNLRGFKSKEMTWEPELEARTVEMRRLKPVPVEITIGDIPHFWELEAPEEYENLAFLQSYLQYYNEVRAYTQLESLQGKGVPRLIGHGTLTPASLQTDPQPRYITPNVLLLEYISDAISLKDADVSMLRPDLIRSLIDTVNILPTLGVVHNDAHHGNYLFSANRAVIIDFGKAILFG